MRNRSIFQGIKEICELQFIDKGGVWDVGEQCGKYYLHRMTIRKIRKESNKALYERAKWLLIESREIQRWEIE